MSGSNNIPSLTFEEFLAKKYPILEGKDLSQIKWELSRMVKEVENYLKGEFPIPVK